MKVYLATDHAGFELKEAMKSFLEEEGYEVEDFGAYELDKEDDYPDFIKQAAEAVAVNPGTHAIIFGGSGQGEAMVANRYAGVRATVFYGGKEMQGSESPNTLEIIRLSKEHNDANVLSIGARFVTPGEAKSAIKLWLETEFSKDERHVRRLSKF